MNIDSRRKIARLVRELRGDTPRVTFAKKIGVSHTTIKDWEQSNVSISYENRKKIARLAGYKSMDEFEKYLNGDPLPCSNISPYKEALKLISQIEDREQCRQIANSAWERSFAVAEESSGYKV